MYQFNIMNKQTLNINLYMIETYVIWEMKREYDTKNSFISYRLSFKITKKSAFTENQTCQRPIKVCQNLCKERYAILGKGNLVEWNESWTIRKEHSDKCFTKKWLCLQETQYHHHN